jgi:SulP family sulfate permease
VLYHLPKATLAATIIVAVTSLIDLAILRLAWRYSRSDFIAVHGHDRRDPAGRRGTGRARGDRVSIALHLHKTSRPHIAIVGEVPGTEHFRNVERHDVITYPSIVSLRIDESLFFANASYLESAIYAWLRSATSACSTSFCSARRSTRSTSALWRRSRRSSNASRNRAS